MHCAADGSEVVRIPTCWPRAVADADLRAYANLDYTGGCAAIAQCQPASRLAAVDTSQCTVKASSNQSTANKALHTNGGYWLSDGSAGEHWLELSPPQGSRVTKLEFVTIAEGSYSPSVEPGGRQWRIGFEQDDRHLQRTRLVNV